MARRALESSTERWCVRWARERKIMVSKLTDPTGIMDHAFWLPRGKVVLIEFKRLGLKPTPLQQYYLDKLAASGYDTFFVDSKDRFIEIMSKFGVV